MKVLKVIFNLIFTFLLVFIILVCFGVNLINTKIINKKYILKVLDENNFYNNILEDVSSGFENFIYQSGLPENTIENLVSIDIIKEDVSLIIDGVTEGKEVNLSSEKIKEELDLRINNYLNDENRTVSKEERENIVKFEDLIVSSYEESVLPISNLVSKINEYYKKVVEIFDMIKYVPFIMLSMIYLFIFIINRKDKFLMLNLSGIGCLSTGILLKLFENVVLNGFDIDNIVMFSNSMTTIVQFVIKDIIYGIGNSGNIFILIGMCLILFFSIIRGSTNLSKKDI